MRPGTPTAGPSSSRPTWETTSTSSSATSLPSGTTARSINVTKCFRNLETWQALAPRLAALWAERHGHVRAWSAGCASGEDTSTLAIALAEAARQLGQESLLEHACVDATDIDRASLERTRAPAFPDAAFSEMPADLARRYFTVEAPRRPLPALQRIVHVLKHDLTTQPPAPWRTCCSPPKASLAT